MSSKSPVRASFQGLIAGAATLVVVVLMIAGARSYRDLVAVKNREAQILQRIENADDRIDRLKEQIEALRDDPATLERMAREDLGLVKPDDVVILLPPEDESPPENG